MERRKAAAIAGAGALTLAAAVLALGANLGLFGLGHGDPDVGGYPVSERSVVPAPAAGVDAGPVAPAAGTVPPGSPTRVDRGQEADGHDDGRADGHDDGHADDHEKDDKRDGDEKDRDEHHRDQDEEEHHDDDD